MYQTYIKQQNKSNFDLRRPATQEQKDEMNNEWKSGIYSQYEQI